MSVSTAAVYQKLRWQEVGARPDTEGMLRAMKRRDVPQMGKLLCNVLESVTAASQPRCHGNTLIYLNKNTIPDTKPFPHQFRRFPRKISFVHRQPEQVRFQFY